MNLHVLPLSELTKAAAAYVSQVSAQAIAARRRFLVAFSGGSLPGLLFPPLATEPLRSHIEWGAWHVFWSDERCVPLTDYNSNYRLAREYLFERVPIPPAQIYAVKTSLDPATAAADYQITLQQVFRSTPGQLPVFDLVLLGMGEDGHTASLFPHHPVLKETGRWVAPVFDSPKPPPERVTLTLPVINHARHVAFLTTGAGKVHILQRVFGEKASPGALPAQMVQPVHGELHWFVDTEAGRYLDTTRGV